VKKIATNRLFTLEQARAWFTDEGVAVSAWADAHGFNPDLVYGVLAGRVQGRRGQAHRIAVALRLKPDGSTKGSPDLWVNSQRTADH
jgi:gp16 family phage-associated protein